MFNFLMKKMLKSQMKGMPVHEQDKIIALIEKNPALFKKIAEEVKEKLDSGKDQYSASMEVLKKYEVELKDVIGNDKK